MKSASRKLKLPTIIQPVLLTNYTVSYSANRNSHPHTAKLGTGLDGRDNSYYICVPII